MAQTVGQGGTIVLDAIFMDGSGTLVNAAPVLVDIINPANTQLVTDGVPTNPSVGTYNYSYTVAGLAPLGLWKAHWTGVINGVAVQGDDFFEVIAAGSIGFDDTVFATVAELKDYLATDFAVGVETRQAEQALRLATAAIRSYTNQHISQVNGETVPVIPMGELILLPELPVTAVASITANGVTVTSSSYTWHKSGIVERTGGWGTGPHLVTYSHGFTSTPGAIKKACLELATSMITNPTDVRQESIGAYSVTFGGSVGPRGGQLIPDVGSVRATLDKFKVQDLS